MDRELTEQLEAMEAMVRTELIVAINQELAALAEILGQGVQQLVGMEAKVDNKEMVLTTIYSMEDQLREMGMMALMVNQAQD